MTMDIKALYQAVERIEDHTATKLRLLTILQAGHTNAAGNPALRARLARDIDQEVREIGALHAERDRIRQQIADLRHDYEQRGWRCCADCGQYKPKHAFSPERRTASGVQSRCRACRAAWLRSYRQRKK